jgi:hypothetical protein
VSSTKHLDTAISILKGGGAKRGKGSTFTLYVSKLPSLGPLDQTGFEGLLQGPRGKTVAMFRGRSAEECKDRARQHVARLPGATLTIFDN